MIRKGDVQWWLLEAEKHPESAPEIIAELAGRLVELDAENERLRDEIVRLEGRDPAPVSAEVDALRQKVSALQGLLDGERTEPSALVLAARLRSARVGLARACELAREGRPLPGAQAVPGLCCLLLTRSQDEVLLLTSLARAFKLSPSAIALPAEGGEWPAVEGLELAEGERLAAAVAVARPPRFWTLVTRRGFARQLIHIDLHRRAEHGEVVVESPFRNDSPACLVDGDRGDLLLVTRWGKGVRFPQRSIAGDGAPVLDLEPDDEIAAAVPLPSDAEVLIATASGRAARLDTARIKARSRPGGAGRPFVQAYDVLGAFVHEPQSRLLYVTYSGRLVLASTDRAPLLARSGKGVQVCALDRDPAVAVAPVPASP
jgi:hypothetical protein